VFAHFARAINFGFGACPLFVPCGEVQSDVADADVNSMQRFDVNVASGFDQLWLEDRALMAVAHPS